MHHRLRQLVLVVSLATIFPAIAVGQTLTVNSVAAPSPVYAGPGATLKATVTGSGNPTDWIALAVTGSPDTSYLTWSYLNGSSPFSFTFTLPGSGGPYEIRLYSNNTYGVMARSPITGTWPASVLTVNGVGGAQTVTLYATDTATVPVLNGPAIATDWVGLYRVGASDNSYLDYFYLNGTKTAPSVGVAFASLSFSVPADGYLYEFRFFAQGSYLRLATSPPVFRSPNFAVDGYLPTSEDVPDLPVEPGAAVPVTLDRAGTGTGDWVGLFAVGAANNAYLSWQYLNGLHSAPASPVNPAALSFVMPTTPGRYEFRLFSGSSNNVLLVSRMVAVGGEPVVSITSPSSTTSFAAGDTVTLTASASDPGPGIAKMAFYADGTLITTLTSAPWTTDWQTSVNGDHALTAVATSASGQWAASTPVTVTISGGSSDGDGGATSDGISIRRFISSTGQTGSVAMAASASAPFADVAWLTATVDGTTLTYAAGAAPLGTAREGHIVWGSTTLTIVQPAAVQDAGSAVWHDEPAGCYPELEDCTEWGDYTEYTYDGPEPSQSHKPVNVMIATADLENNQIYVRVGGDDTGRLVVRLHGPGLHDEVIGTKENAARGVHGPFNFGQFLQPTRTGSYNRVTATWEVSGTVDSPMNRCTPNPDPGTPCGQKVLSPLTLVSIVVRCRPVGDATAALIGALHCYGVTANAGVVTTVEGSEYASRTDGLLVMRVYPGDSIGVNRPSDLTIVPTSNVSSFNVQCLQDMAVQINNLHSPYHAVSGPNSNSAIATAMRLCGMPVILPPQAIAQNTPLGPIP